MASRDITERLPSKRSATGDQVMVLTRDPARAGELFAGIRRLNELEPYSWVARGLRLPGFYGLAILLYEGIHAPTLMCYNARRRARKSK